MLYLHLQFTYLFSSQPWDVLAAFAPTQGRPSSGGGGGGGGGGGARSGSPTDQKVRHLDPYLVIDICHYSRHPHTKGRSKS